MTRQSAAFVAGQNVKWRCGADHDCECLFRVRNIKFFVSIGRCVERHVRRLLVYLNFIDHAPFGSVKCGSQNIV